MPGTDADEDGDEPIPTADGRLRTTDGGLAGEDPLLERLFAVHHEPRYDIAPQIAEAAAKHGKRRGRNPHQTA